MRIAYIGHDSSSLKSLNILDGPNHSLVYFLKNKEQDLHLTPFLETPIFSDRCMIPALAELRTAEQNAQYQVIAKNHHVLQSRICTIDKPKSSGEKRMSTKKPVVADLTEIMDIHFDSKNKKVIIEVEKRGVEAFDFLFTEAHPLVSSYFQQKNIKVFKHIQSTNSVWSSVSFEAQPLKPVLSLPPTESFFTVLDPDRDTLVDNWFFCTFFSDKIQAWTFQPFNQLNNPEFQNFYIDRIRISLAKKFTFLYLGNFISSQTTSIAADLSQAQLSISSAAVVPNFGFWSDDQIESYLTQILIKFQKKNKATLEAIS